MEKLTVDPDLLKSLLGASYSTYMAHRGDDNELYALGALEATSNLIYVLTCDGANEELATMAQMFAGVALDRTVESLGTGQSKPAKISSISKN